MATQDKPPAPPKGLDASRPRLWKSVTTDYDLDVHEQLLLVQACRCVDRLDRLAEEAAAAEVTVINARGDQVPHPRLTESRQQSLTLARLLASLRLPSGEEEGRPQHRGAVRGTYGPRRLGVIA